VFNGGDQNYVNKFDLQQRVEMLMIKRDADNRKGRLYSKTAFSFNLKKMDISKSYCGILIVHCGALGWSGRGYHVYVHPLIAQPQPRSLNDDHFDLSDCSRPICYLFYYLNFSL
jgi:hypothetical protein